MLSCSYIAWFPGYFPLFCYFFNSPLFNAFNHRYNNFFKFQRNISHNVSSTSKNPNPDFIPLFICTYTILHNTTQHNTTVFIDCTQLLQQNYLSIYLSSFSSSFLIHKCMYILYVSISNYFQARIQPPNSHLFNFFNSFLSLLMLLFLHRYFITFPPPTPPFTL